MGCETPLNLGLMQGFPDLYVFISLYVSGGVDI